MKKILAITLATMLMTGCSITISDSDDKNDSITKTDNIHIEFWTDEETGVQYVIYDRVGGYAGMGGITPRLNSDGSVYIEK